MRIPTSVALLFSGLLLIGVVQGATVTIGPTQGHVEYRITLNNQSSTLARFLLNESAQPTGQNEIVLVTANLISTLRNFTYSRALNTSSFPEVFPYLLGISNQSLSYHTYGISLALHIVNTGNTQIAFKGQSFQGKLSSDCISNLPIGDCISFCNWHHRHNAFWTDPFRPA